MKIATFLLGILLILPLIIGPVNANIDISCIDPDLQDDGYEVHFDNVPDPLAINNDMPTMAKLNKISFSETKKLGHYVCEELDEDLSFKGYRAHYECYTKQMWDQGYSVILAGNLIQRELFVFIQEFSFGGAKLLSKLPCFENLDSEGHNY